MTPGISTAQCPVPYLSVLTHLSPTRSRWGLREPAHPPPSRAAHAQHPTVSAARARRKDRRGYRDRRLWNPGHTARHLWKLSPKSRFRCPHPKSRRLQGLLRVPAPTLSIRQTRVGVGEEENYSALHAFIAASGPAGQSGKRTAPVTSHGAGPLTSPARLQPRPRLPRRAPPRSRSRSRQRPEGGQ